MADGGRRADGIRPYGFLPKQPCRGGYQPPAATNFRLKGKTHSRTKFLYELSF